MNLKPSANQIHSKFSTCFKRQISFLFHSLSNSQQAEDSIRNQAAMREIAQIELNQALSQLDTELTEQSKLNITRLLALSGI
jgi:hypothetical protein